MLDDRGVLIEDVEGAEKFMTLMYYRLLAEDHAISTTELQHGDLSCLVDVSCDVDQSDIRLLVLKVKTGTINDVKPLVGLQGPNDSEKEYIVAPAADVQAKLEASEDENGDVDDEDRDDEMIEVNMTMTTKSMMRS
ncbi:hypothetical protein PsorP6_000208 [Peronosclerospora sorghi]|uniref:Uncharacterized protein n=1 Tax=Peronosclerospora sorghi TaxID=230839 RepID=A0ACC0WW10_9STRA|nr:hypothetical protein PsorP6_000208 [Peronosclerospora sorghi]